MFSANENLLLRKHKRRIVDFIEECIPEAVLDLGTSVMVMQVSCKAPGCVPLETAIIIVFPACQEELLPGLAESKGGSFKTKVLLPMAEVTQQDVLEALPPAFTGGLRSMEKLCVTARDVMLAQITQLFGDDDLEGRKLMALYLQQSLQDYIDRDCVPPPLDEPFPDKQTTTETNVETQTDTANVASAPSTTALNPTVAPPTVTTKSTSISKGTGNEVIRRPVDDVTETKPVTTNQRTRPTPAANTTRTTIPVTNVSSVASQRLQQSVDRQLMSNNSNSGNILARLNEREHAPGIRRPGCPCCDPDNPSNVVDQMMQL
jgi:hypothetical protein